MYTHTYTHTHARARTSHPLAPIGSNLRQPPHLSNLLFLSFWRYLLVNRAVVYAIIGLEFYRGFLQYQCFAPIDDRAFTAAVMVAGNDARARACVCV